MHRISDLESANQHLAGLSVEERIVWMDRAAESRSRGHPGSKKLIILCSGGEFSAIIPDIVSRVLHDSAHIPLVFVDVGYFKPETYHQVRQIRDSGYNLHTYSCPWSPAMQEAWFGALEYQREHDFGNFKQRVKLDPFRRAISELNPVAWIDGQMRYDGTEGREELRLLERKEGIYRLHPIADWSRDQALEYATKQNLPLNPHHYDPTKGPKQNQQCGIHTLPVRADYQI